jgi:hypothetical protein
VALLPLVEARFMLLTFAVFVEVVVEIVCGVTVSSNPAVFNLHAKVAISCASAPQSWGLFIVGLSFEFENQI